MKLMRSLLLITLGLFAGLWLAESARNRKLTAQTSRDLDALSAAYKARRTPLAAYSEDEIAAHLHALTTQLVQPNMTELEAERAGLALSEIARDALSWQEDRKRREDKRDRQAEAWLEEVEGGDDE